MDEDLKKNIKQAARTTEAKLTEAVLRWKYKRDGKEIPDAKGLEAQSRIIMDQAHETLSRSGKNLWGELKRAYRKKAAGENRKD